MTDLSRGARLRRGGRRPGWPLLTALLVLAIAASSALVFTNRVELLKLAVILALWAAVVAAFVSVIYRRQSDLDQARVRDLKLVYDLQLDREISARREYELTVESQLRRELASELRAQAADEVASLRAELAALRTNLELLFDTELGERPALESERATVRGYSDWERQDESRREWVNRVTSVRAEDAPGQTEETSIIDVPEVPPGYEEPLVSPRPDGYAYQAPEAFLGARAYEPAQAPAGPRWQQTERAGPVEQDHARWAPPERFEPAPQHDARPPYEPSPPPPEPQPSTWATPDPPRRRRARDPDWQPVGADGLWLPPGTPGSNWVSGPPDEPSAATPPRVERRGRHSGPAEPAPPPTGARHSAESGAEPQSEPPRRHRSLESSSDPDAPRSGGQSVAELLARLQVNPTGGGRRRRREE